MGRSLDGSEGSGERRLMLPKLTGVCLLMEMREGAGVVDDGGGRDLYAPEECTFLASSTFPAISAS
jgi:hypothetical protein